MKLNFKKIGRVALIVAAILVALAILAFMTWLTIIWWASIVAFFVTLITAIGLFLLFSIPATLFIVWLNTKQKSFRREGKWLFVAILVLLLAHAAMATRGHFVERSRQEPTRQKFVALAETGGTIVNGNPIYGEGQLDYNGEIQNLVDKRRATCRRDGFIYLGSWTVTQVTPGSEPLVETSGIYIWAPWIALW